MAVGLTLWSCGLSTEIPHDLCIFKNDMVCDVKDFLDEGMLQRLITVQKPAEKCDVAPWALLCVYQPNFEVVFICS